MFDRDDAHALGHPRCKLCGDRVGVYEPAVYVIGMLVKRTSRAAEPQLDAIPGRVVFHADCYEQAGA